MPTLYVVATPIGNLEDITLRALRVLGEVGLIAAEDTRVTRKLLNRHGIKTPMVSYREHNKQTELPRLLTQLSQKDVALVTDAGVPAVSDPGTELVQAAAAAGFDVAPIPGASALTSALSVSGLAAEEFVYLGFLPRRRADRVRLLESFATDKRALLAFEAPHRLRAALGDMLGALGDRQIAVCRELTKVHEEVFRGPVSEALSHFSSPRGEFTLVVQGAPEGQASGIGNRKRGGNKGVAGRAALPRSPRQGGGGQGISSERSVPPAGVQPVAGDRGWGAPRPLKS